MKQKYNQRYPLRSVVNYALIRLCKLLKTNQVIGYPSKIHIEPTNICNLKCPLCPTGMGVLNRPKGSMGFEKFKQIVDEIKPYTTEMLFAGYGEPFLNKDIFRMTKYAADSGITVSVFTNALMVDKIEKIHNLLKSGITDLTVSIDGTTQETYEKYRVGSNLTKVLENIKSIIEEKKVLNLLKPYVRFQIVVTSINEIEVEDSRKLAMKLGADSHFIKKENLLLVTPPPNDELPNIIEKYYPKEKKFRRYARPKKDVNSCSMLYKEAFICWNGDVLSCCYDTFGLNFMGNIFNECSFYNVWNGEKYRILRKQVNNDIRTALPLCYMCPNRFEFDF